MRDCVCVYMTNSECYWITSSSSSFIFSWKILIIFIFIFKSTFKLIIYRWLIFHVIHSIILICYNMASSIHKWVKHSLLTITLTAFQIIFCVIFSKLAINNLRIVVSLCRIRLPIFILCMSLYRAIIEILLSPIFSLIVIYYLILCSWNAAPY